MSTPVKIGLILLGALVITIAAGIGGLMFLGGKMMQAGRDPAFQRRTAAKIAQFTLPSGFRIASAFDSGLQQQVIIVPTTRRQVFQIQLQGGYSSLDPGTVQQITTLSFGVAGKLIHCTYVTEPDDRLIVRGKPVTLHVSGCGSGPMRMRVETGTVPGASGNVMVTAMGSGDGFDIQALHELLRSFR